MLPRKLIAALVLLGGGSLVQDDPARYVRPGENIARGKTYRLEPAPRYALSSDPSDDTQLTDGEYTVGRLWAQKTTVGWKRGSNVTITFDLGRIEPIGGISFHTAGGVAGVRWPSAIHMFVSDDGRHWWYGGEMLRQCAEQNGPPPDYGNYTTWRFWSDRLRLHGRHLALVVSEASYTFVDEVEIYRGASDLVRMPRTGRSWPGLAAAVQGIGLRAEVEADLHEVRASLAAADISSTDRLEVAAILARAEADLGKVEVEGSRALLPYGPPHRLVFAAQAALHAAAGRPGLVVAAANRWDPLVTTRPPGARPAAIDVELMRGEVRGAAFTLFSTSPVERRLTLRCEGLGAPRPSWLRLYGVRWTATRAGRAAASALSELDSSSEGWSLDLIPGLPQQVWVAVDGEMAGLHTGSIVLTEGARRVGSVPVAVRVSSLVMPEEKTLIVSGWDYTDGAARGIRPGNREQCVEFLRRHGVNATWATRAVLPFGEHAADGALAKPPDTQRLDAWIARWPRAKLYCVFMSAREPVPDVPAAQKRVAEWINFYARHLVAKGVEPDRLALLFFDEPRTPAGAAITISWARAIKKVQPRVRIFADPTYRDASKTPAELLRTADIISPNRGIWLSQRQVHEEAYLPYRSADRAFAFYSCAGPVRQLDPYSYHRLQAWEVWRYGGNMSSFWAFSDNGAGSSWNELASPRTDHAPQFLDDDGCSSSKHMEAIRESQLDFEYLTLLRKRVESTSPGSPVFVARAKTLLATAAERVLAGEAADDIWWTKDRDRSVADEVRLEILAALEMP